MNAQERAAYYEALGEYDLADEMRLEYARRQADLARFREQARQERKDFQPMKTYPKNQKKVGRGGGVAGLTEGGN